MKWSVTVLTILLAVAPVSAGEGFSLRWSNTISKDFSSIAAIDADYEGYVNDLLAGSWDNNVYAFNSNGILLGSWEARSSITSVGAFVHDGDGKLNDGIAGSLDDRVYAFWRPYGKERFSSESIWWEYNTGDDVYAVAGVDLSTAVRWLESRSGQKNSIAVGVGSYVGTEYGKVLAFSYNRTSLWNYSASTRVTVLSSADLDSDGIASNVLVGAGSSITALDSNGGSIWSYDTKNAVTTISPADFYSHGEFEGIIAGAGSIVYALDPRSNKLLWQHDLGAKVVSISAVDINKDNVIDYYLVAAGTKIYALQNSPSKGNVLWNYNFGKNIDKHVSIDFDGDGVLDDIAFISGSSIYAYDQNFLYLPHFSISKSVSLGSAKVGEYVTVTLRLENIGDGRASSVKLQDGIPEGLELGSGKTSLSEESIGVGIVKELSYTLKAVKAGIYELPAVEVEYKDEYGESYKAVSNRPAINVSTKEGAAPPPTPPVEKKEKLPKLSVQRNVSKTANLTVGENVTVVITLKNLGEAPALNISFKDTLPAGLSLIKGENFWKGELEPNKSKAVSYVIVPKESAVYRLTELSVTYRDSSGKTYEESTPPLLILAAEEERFITSLLLAGIVFLFCIALAMVLLRRRGIKIKLPGFIKVDPQLEKKFLKVYREYQLKGKRPTYGDMKRELGVEVSVVERLVLFVKMKVKLIKIKAAVSNSEFVSRIRERLRKLWVR